MGCIHSVVFLNENGEKQCFHCNEVKQLRIDPAQAWSPAAAAQRREAEASANDIR